jgi:hypothetical protein
MKLTRILPFFLLGEMALVQEVMEHSRLIGQVNNIRPHYHTGIRKGCLAYV